MRVVFFIAYKKFDDVSRRRVLYVRIVASFTRFNLEATIMTLTPASKQ
jgi:hypothetical protein